MEKCIIFLLAILCSNVNLFAQSEISGTVYNKNNECVCSVTITLYCESNSSSTYEVMTDEEGYFEFKNIEEGNYFLVASKDGYTDSIIDNLRFPAHHDKVVSLSLKTKYYYPLYNFCN